MIGTTHIKTYDELRDNAATMGMVFFGLRYGRPRVQRSQYMDIGISICEVITKGRSLSEGSITNYADLAVVEAFRAFEHQKEVRPDKLANLESDAQPVKEILERLKRSETVSVEELDRSASFFRKICSDV